MVLETGSVLIPGVGVYVRPYASTKLFCLLSNGVTMLSNGFTALSNGVTVLSTGVTLLCNGFTWCRMVQSLV